MDEDGFRQIEEFKQELAKAFGIFLCQSCGQFYAVEERPEPDEGWKQLTLPFKEFHLCPICEHEEWAKHIN